MTLETRKNFLDRLVADPPTYGGCLLGNGPSMGSEIKNFLTTVTKNGTLAAGTKQMNTPAKYKYMSVNSGRGRGASKKNTNGFTKGVGEFFCLLFRQVSSFTGHSLHKSDLWHGHLIETRNTGVCVVFHAKEYPNDLDVDGSSANRSGKFSSESRDFRWRNVIWKASANKIYKIDAGVYQISKDIVVEHSPLYDNVIEDIAKEFSWDVNFMKQKRAARTLDQDELGTPRVDLYYLMNESYFTKKSSHIVMRPIK